jgi:hypothetical protein
VYSRQNRNPRTDVSVELPRDYGGSAFYPFPSIQGRVEAACEPPEAECRAVEKCEKACETSVGEPKHPAPPLLGGLSGLLGGNIGLEELLLLGIIFLIFTDSSLRDNELLICLLLILFI